MKKNTMIIAIILFVFFAICFCLAVDNMVMMGMIVWFKRHWISEMSQCLELRCKVTERKFVDGETSTQKTWKVSKEQLLEIGIDVFLDREYVAYIIENGKKKWLYVNDIEALTYENGEVTLFDRWW